MMNAKKVPPGHKKWLDTIHRAARKGDLCLMRGRLRATGEPATILCAVGMERSEYVLTPLAHLPDANPFEHFVSIAEFDEGEGVVA